MGRSAIKKKFHPVHNRRVSDEPVLNKLAFNGYHIQGIFDGREGSLPFHDHYETLERYHASFAYVTSGHVLSPREIYLSKEGTGEHDIVIRDNAGVVLWSDEIEAQHVRNL